MPPKPKKTSYRGLIEPPLTPLYQLIEAKLNERPIDFIHALRTAKPPMPYAKIADEIKAITEVYLTHEAVRRWYRIATGEDDPGDMVAA